jgi:hypothetical protein
MGTGLTGLCLGLALVQGEYAYVQGGALVFFGGLCSLLEHSFVSDVSSRCPCLAGPRLVMAFDHLLEFLLFVSFPFVFS